MLYVRQIGWEVVTSTEGSNGSKAQSSSNGPEVAASVTVLRDDDPIVTLDMEPGYTPCLSRGNATFYYWTFSGNCPDPNLSADGDNARVEHPRQDYVEFANGVAGHLRCRFEVGGDNQWQTDQITGYVRYLHRQSLPGTIDSTAWMPDQDWTRMTSFDVGATSRTDSSGETCTWTLSF